MAIEERTLEVCWTHMKIGECIFSTLDNHCDSSKSLDCFGKMAGHGDKHRRIKRQKTSKKENQFADEDINYVEEYEEYYQDGEGLQKRDFSNLELKLDHYNRPLWVFSDV